MSATSPHQLPNAHQPWNDCLDLSRVSSKRETLSFKYCCCSSGDCRRPVVSQILTGPSPRGFFQSALARRQVLTYPEGETQLFKATDLKTTGQRYLWLGCYPFHTGRKKSQPSSKTLVVCVTEGKTSPSPRGSAFYLEVRVATDLSRSQRL